MGFNVFATAIASKKPIFYLDSKPDTSVVMKALNDGIFAFNGGKNYDETMDIKPSFPRDGGKFHFQYPSYFEIKDSDCYNFAYFKALSLVYTMFYYVDHNTGEKTNTLLQYIGKGGVLVLDEFNSYTEEFLKPIFSAGSGSWLSNSLSDAGFQSEMTNKSSNKCK